MPRGKLAGLAVNLPRLLAEEFSVSIALDRDAVKRIGAAFGKAEDGLAHVPYVSHYTRAKKRHEISAHFFFSKPSRQVTGLHVLFDMTPMKYEQANSFEVLFSKLAEMELEVQADCDVTFLYSSERWRSVFTLPWKIFESEAVPFDEVRGLRVAKTSGDTTLWSSIVDLVGKNVMTNVSYGFAGPLNERFFSDAFVRAQEISSRLVKRLTEVQP